MRLVPRGHKVRELEELLTAKALDYIKVVQFRGGRCAIQRLTRVPHLNGSAVECTGP